MIAMIGIHISIWSAALGGFLAAIWQRILTTISPSVAGDNVDVGTGRLLRGASPATVGEVALSDNDRVTCRTGAVDQAVISSNGTTVTVGGAPGVGTTRPATVTLDPSGSFKVLQNGVERLYLSGTDWQFITPTVTFKNSVVSPALYQADLATAGASGQTTTVRAQNVTAADALVAGKLLLKGGDSSGAAGTGGNYETAPGHGSTHGRWIAYDADGVTERVGWDAAGGDVALNGGTQVHLKVGGGNRLTIATNATLSCASLYWNANVAAPGATQLSDATAAVTCDDMTLGAQGASNATGGASKGTSGNLLVRGGQGTVHADNYDGNVAAHAVPASWNAMEKGIFEGECVTAPTGNPVAGIYRYVLAGAGVARGTGGTVTTYAPAGPHCPECGYDHPRVAMANERFGSYLFECGMCGHVEKHGPQSVLGMLTADEQFDTLKKNDHAHNMARLTHKHRAGLPRKRSHEPMLDEYNRALAAALAEADGEVCAAKHGHVGAIKRAAQRADEATLASYHAKQADATDEQKEAARAADEAVSAAEALAAQLLAKADDVAATAHAAKLAAVESEWADKWDTWTTSCEANEAGSTVGLHERRTAVHAEHANVARAKRGKK